MIFTNNSSDINEKYSEVVAFMDSSLGYGVNFDIVRKKIMIGGRVEAVYYGINAFNNGQITEQIVEYLIRTEALAGFLPHDKESFLKNLIPYSRRKNSFGSMIIVMGRCRGFASDHIRISSSASSKL